MLLESLSNRLNVLASQNEDLQMTLKVFSRIMIEKGLATKEEIKEALKKDHEVLKELGAVENSLTEEEAQELCNELYTHIVGSPKEIKQRVEEARKEMEERLKKEESKIEIANANTLNMLNNSSMSSNKKIIL